MINTIDVCLMIGLGLVDLGIFCIIMETIEKRRNK